MEKTKELLELFHQIEKHIRFLESNIISEEDENAK